MSRDMFGNDLTATDSFGTPRSDISAELAGAEEYRRQLVKAMEAIQSDYPQAYRALRQQWLQVDNRIQYLKGLSEGDRA